MSGEQVRARVRRSKAEWLSLFQAQASSGLSQLQFCRQQGISTAAFYNARSRYAQPSDAGRSVQSDDFVALTLPTASEDRGWDIELLLGGDVVLRLRRS
ncbi:MAG: IS66 family insertion sequence element accessory protein TnpB [Gammaproteobacteria bacterium]|nr:IS66 family insertion sequence element accessory protein TnpB [Gammaproteobacteria bacterium]